MAEARQEFPIEQQLRKDVREAQRARDQLKLDTLRMALGAIHNLEVARTDRKTRNMGGPSPRAIRSKCWSRRSRSAARLFLSINRAGAPNWSKKNSARWRFCRAT